MANTIDQYRDCQRISILCRYKDVYISNNIVNIIVQAVSEEPAQIKKDEEKFTQLFRKYEPDCYSFSIRELDDFYQFPFLDEYGLAIGQLSDDEYNDLNEYIEEKFDGKLIEIEPIYKMRNDNFYKNARLIRTFSGNCNANYSLLPGILGSDIQKFRKFVSSVLNKSSEDQEDESIVISLPSWIYTAYDIPQQITDGEYIYQLPLESYDSLALYKVVKSKLVDQIQIFKVQDGFNNKIIHCNDFQTNIYFVSLACKAEFVDAKDELTKIAVQAKSKPILQREEKLSASKTCRDFQAYLATNGVPLSYELDDIFNFYTCLKSSNLTILEGLSGTGKTKLPLKFAQYFSLDEFDGKDGNLLFIPISPSYTEPNDLLGFYNPSQNKYIPSETGLIPFLKKASEKRDEIFLVVFDEMNLAPIEYYFSPFLSVLEKDGQGRRINLYDPSLKPINGNLIPSSIQLNSNVIFVGTINQDETTKALSNRLLDRSFVINLKKVKFSELKADFQNTDVKEFTPAALKALMGDRDYSNTRYMDNISNEMSRFFDDLHDRITMVDSSIGVSFRNIKNISIYLSNIPEDFDNKKALDYALCQTIIKKIRGLEDSVGPLLGLENTDESKSLENLFDSESFKELSDFAKCREEIKRKRSELNLYGYCE